MADVTAHVGDRGVAEVEIHDASGAVTTDWDVAGGIQWSSTNEAAVFVSDPDANPQDAAIEFRALTTGDVFLEASFDGEVGEEERRITLRSQSIAVVPGAATGGVLRIRMTPVA